MIRFLTTGRDGSASSATRGPVHCDKSTCDSEQTSGLDFHFTAGSRIRPPGRSAALLKRVHSRPGGGTTAEASMESRQNHFKR